MSALTVEHLRVAFPGVQAVDGLSFDLAPGRSLGIVGESGSGKSAAALAMLGLHRGSSAIVEGRILVGGTDVVSATDAQVRAVRGAQVAMVFQDPLSALDPFQPIGDQIAEVYRTHTRASRKAARARAVEVLNRVHIPDAERRARSHPHEFSGGMRQRALIAMALACEPKVIVADEPTTALDVTVQAQILDLLHELRTTTGTALVLISHDIGVIAGMADEVVVLRRGATVEQGPADTVLTAPAASYTRELLAAVPRLDASHTVPRTAREPLITVDGLEKHYRRGVKAVDGVTLDVLRGETLGIVGESGSGKTTLARMLVGLLEPTAGRVTVLGARHRGDLQMVFQDPLSSLNPRRTVGDSIAEPLRVQGGLSGVQRRRKVESLLDRVGLDAKQYDRYPHELSGGMRQRVGIARAIAPGPRLVVCDEPVSSLDVTTQAQILRLLDELRRDEDLTLVFVSHDLAVVRQVSDRVAVMRDGRVVELADADELYANPRHEYTIALLEAAPVPDPVLAREKRALRMAGT